MNQFSSGNWTHANYAVLGKTWMNGCFPLSVSSFCWAGDFWSDLCSLCRKVIYWFPFVVSEYSTSIFVTICFVCDFKKPWLFGCGKLTFITIQEGLIQYVLFVWRDGLDIFYCSASTICFVSFQKKKQLQNFRIFSKKKLLISPKTFSSLHLF